jgi:putative flippase GtrA
VVSDPAAPRGTGAAAWRFLLVGGLNTLVTTILLIGLSYLMPGWIAYTVVFAIGLVFSTVFASRWVFTRAGTRTAALLYAVAYVLIYLVGLGCIELLRLLDGPEFLNGLTVLVTAPLGFLAGRIVFRQRRREESA